MRKIDALVAEKVMGVASRAVRICGSTESVTVYTNNPFFHDGFCSRHDLETYAQPRPYSTDIAAAWEVVDALSPRCAQVDVWACGPNFNRCYIHSFHEGIEWKEGHIDGDAAGEGRTAPIAICLAALRAVGVTEAEIQAAMEDKP